MNMNKDRIVSFYVPHSKEKILIDGKKKAKRIGMSFSNYLLCLMYNDCDKKLRT